MLLMFLGACTGNQEVVDVNVDKVQSSENLVNKTLEGLGCVSEAKGHSQEFK